MRILMAMVPSSWPLRAPGSAAWLHFRRRAKPTCADQIVFQDLKVRKRLAPDQTISVDLPTQSARTLRFTCGMNMMKGTGVVQ